MWLLTYNLQLVTNAWLRLFSFTVGVLLFVLRFKQTFIHPHLKIWCEFENISRHCQNKSRITSKKNRFAFFRRHSWARALGKKKTTKTKQHACDVTHMLRSHQKLGKILANKNTKNGVAYRRITTNGNWIWEKMPNQIFGWASEVDSKALKPWRKHFYEDRLFLYVRLSIYLSAHPCIHPSSTPPSIHQSTDRPRKNKSAGRQVGR